MHVKLNTIILSVLLIIFISPVVFSDGGIVIYDNDMWNMFNEDQQYCAINYKDGYQKMIIAVDTEGALKGDKAVWIFPIPAKPDNVEINIIKGFPSLRGKPINREAYDTISERLLLSSLTQIYTYPLFIFFSFRNAGGMRDGLEVHERVQKMGMTTELVTAEEAGAFYDYLTEKGIDLPDNFKSILEDYIGQNYSFVVSWISDVEKFKLDQGIIEDADDLISLFNEFEKTADKKIPSSLKKEFEQFVLDNYEETSRLLKEKHIDFSRAGTNLAIATSNKVIERFTYEKYKEKYDENQRVFEKFRGYLWDKNYVVQKNTLGVFINFPTKRIYYPLKPTSSYGDERIPIVIYIIGFVTPDLYKNIRPYTEMTYFLNGYYYPQEEKNLEDFFNTNRELIFNYTKVKINTTSKQLTEDLWFDVRTPPKVKFFTFMFHNTTLISILTFIICSSLASLIASLLVFKNNKPAKANFALLGIFNFFTLVGFTLV
ncbi:MAG: hypothetical protein J7K31_00015, partial [Candidatus Aenigmarchaeota archaeon]|nr:hypothetical protein [Candidatus Aenigmarchaeota archaeon]